MYARVITNRFLPGHTAAGITLYRNSWLVAKKPAGFLATALLVDRETDDVMWIDLFQDHMDLLEADELHRSSEAWQGFTRRGSSLMVGPARIDDYQLPVLDLKPSQIQRAVVVQGHLRPGSIYEAIGLYHEALNRTSAPEGRTGCFLLVNENTGDGVEVDLWESEIAEGRSARGVAADLELERLGAKIDALWARPVAARRYEVCGHDLKDAVACASQVLHPYRGASDLMDQPSV